MISELSADERVHGILLQLPLPDGGDVLGYHVQLSMNVEFIKESE